MGVLEVFSRAPLRYSALFTFIKNNCTLECGALSNRKKTTVHRPDFCPLTKEKAIQVISSACYFIPEAFGALGAYCKPREVENRSLLAPLPALIYSVNKLHN